MQTDKSRKAMDDELKRRINSVFPIITSDVFLEGRNLSKDIAFHIFDYPPEHEVEISEFVEDLFKRVQKSRPELKVLHINLFRYILDYLERRKILEKSFELQRKKGDEALLNALAAPLHPEKIVDDMKRHIDLAGSDLVLISGVGTAFPLIRSHGLLNNLHSALPGKPLVMFFPGRYDGQSLKLFGLLGDDNYYRAFRLTA